MTDIDTASIAIRAANIDGETRVGDLIDLLMDLGEHAWLAQFERITAECERLAQRYLAENSIPAQYQRRLDLAGGAHAQH